MITLNLQTSLYPPNHEQRWKSAAQYRGSYREIPHLLESPPLCTFYLSQFDHRQICRHCNHRVLSERNKITTLSSLSHRKFLQTRISPASLGHLQELIEQAKLKKNKISSKIIALILYTSLLFTKWKRTNSIHLLSGACQCLFLGVFWLVIWSINNINNKNCCLLLGNGLYNTFEFKNIKSL